MESGPQYDLAHALAALIAIGALLSTLALLGAKLVHEQIRVYAMQSFFAAAFAALVGIHRGSADLIVLGVLTLAIKSFLLPIGINRQITFQVAEHEVPLVIEVPMSLLIGGALAGFAYWSASALGATGTLLPNPVLGMPIALILVGLFFMITRQNLISQIVGLLVLENGVFFATVTLAPALPFAVGFLLLFDVITAVIFYGVLARLVVARTAGHERRRHERAAGLGDGLCRIDHSSFAAARRRVDLDHRRPDDLGAVLDSRQRWVRWRRRWSSSSALTSSMAKAHWARPSM